MTNETEPARPPRRDLFVTAGVALVIGTAVAVLFVLPAETGIDPTGVGKATGLSAIANPDASRLLERGLKRKGVFTPSETPLPAETGARDHWEFELHPYESIELKYVIDKDGPINFHWSASAPLSYDMHAHPFDGGEELTESYSVAKSDHLGGHYVAAFSVIHGWHWQNRGLEPVKIKLTASGAIKGSRLIESRGEQDRSLTPRAE